MEFFSAGGRAYYFATHHEGAMWSICVSRQLTNGLVSDFKKLRAENWKRTKFRTRAGLCVVSETPLPSRPADRPQRVIRLSVLCTFSAPQAGHVCVCVCACMPSSLTGFPRLRPGECGSQGRNQTAEQWRASST